MFPTPSGKPGVLPSYTATPREIFAANRSFAQFIAAPVTIDGTLSGNALNAPYAWLLFAGTLLGRVTATGKYANSIIGLTSAAYAHGGASNGVLQTDANTAAEVLRRVGPAGTLQITGAAPSGGALVTETITYTAVNTTTGQIAITPGTADLNAGALIQPTDGSQTPVTLICDAYGVRVADPLSGQRLDTFDAQLLAAGGTINTFVIVNYPPDGSVKAYLKSSLRQTCPGVNFSDDFA